MTETLYPHEWVWQNFGEIVASIGVAGMVFFCGSIVVAYLTYEPSGTLDAVSIYNHPAAYYGDFSPAPLIITIIAIAGVAWLWWMKE